MNEMNSRALRWYVVFSMILLIVLTGTFVYRLVHIRNGNYDSAASHFLSFSEDVSKSSSRSFDEVLRAYPPIQVITIFNYEKGVEYLWARSPEYFGTYDGSTSDTVPTIAYDELTQTQFSRGYTDANDTSHIITAVYTILDGPSVFPVLRDTLIAILVFILFALVIAVIQTAESRKTVAVEAIPSLSDSPPVEAAESSGLSDERLLDRRLSLELERAAFNEQDFSAAILEFPEVKRDRESYALLAETILEFFSFEDLCFEYGDEKIVILFPSTNLKETLATLERFQHHFWQQRESWIRNDVEIYAGVSSRNGRLVDGPRLLQESSAALHRAHEISGHIVGFEPDPQKYREFLLSE